MCMNIIVIQADVKHKMPEYSAYYGTARYGQSRYGIIVDMLKPEGSARVDQPEGWIE